MLRLSQKAWNNVVIFAMLFMVYLFTVSNEMLNDDEGSEVLKQPLFPAFSVIMSIDFGVIRLDRIGQDWRVSQNSTAGGTLVEQQSEDLLTQLLGIKDSWSNLEAIPFVAEPTTNPFIVTIQLAGEDKKRVYQLFEFDGGVLLNLNADWYFVDGVSITGLFFTEALKIE